MQNERKKKQINQLKNKKDERKCVKIFVLYGLEISQSLSFKFFFRKFPYFE